MTADGYKGGIHALAGGLAATMALYLAPSPTYAAWWGERARLYRDRYLGAKDARLVASFTRERAEEP